MIKTANSLRLLQYNQSRRATAGAATPQARYAPDQFSRSTPAPTPAPRPGVPSFLTLPPQPAPSANRELDEVRQTISGIIRVLNVLPPQELDKLYQKFDLQGHPDVVEAARVVGVQEPKDANGLMRMLNALSPADTDRLIQRFNLAQNRDLKRIGGWVQALDLNNVPGLVGMLDLIKPKKRTVKPPQDVEGDKAYVTSLYRDLLGRDPDPDGFQSHMNGLANGTSRDQLRQIFLDSPEYKEKQSRPAPAPAPQPAPEPPKPKLPANALPALPTVPVTEEFANAPIDKGSDEAALMSAAVWVKQTYPQLFTQGDDRPLAYKMMTKVIGVLRAHGFDAYRIVNHSSRPVGDPGRYGSDALVLNDTVYDVYGSLGEANRPQVLRHGPMSGNQRKE